MTLAFIEDVLCTRYSIQTFTYFSHLMLRSPVKLVLLFNK